MSRIMSASSRRRTQPGAFGGSLPDRLPDSVGNTVTVTNASTLLSAISAAGAGTTIQCHAGNYGLTQFTSKRVGTSNPITITGFPGEAAPVFIGQSAYTNAFLMTNCQGFRLDGLIFEAPTNVNLKINNCQNIEINRCISRNAGNSYTGTFGPQGLLVVGDSATGTVKYSDDIQCWNSVFTHNGGPATGAGSSAGHDHSIYWGSGGGLEGSSTECGVRSGVIANCLIYDQHDGYGIQLGGSARGTIIANNTIAHCFAPANAFAGSAIVVWYGNGPYGTRNNVIVNNILTHNTQYSVQGSGTLAGANNLVRNNLVFGNGFGNYTQITDYTVVSTASTSDPQYFNYAGKDFRLDIDSPALGAAEIAFCPAQDIGGNDRPSTPALGCYESV